MQSAQGTVHIMQLSSSFYIFLQNSVSSSEHQTAYYSRLPLTYVRFQVLQPLLKLQISGLITRCRLTVWTFRRSALSSSSGSRNPTTVKCWNLPTMALCPFGTSVKIYKSTRRNKPEDFKFYPQLIPSLHVNGQVSHLHLISPSMTLI